MNIELVSNWRQAFRMYSVWVFAILGSMGDIYNALQTAGLLDGAPLPEVFLRSLNLVAVVGVIVRLVRQRALELEKSGELKDLNDLIDPPK